MQKYQQVIKRTLATLSCLCFFLAVTAHAGPHIIIFGDSLADAGMNTVSQDSGNNTWTVTSGKVGAPITSLDEATHTHPLWVNWVAANKWNETLYPFRVLQEQHLDPATHSVSYAYASAETGNHYLNDLAEGAPPVVDTTCSAPGVVTPGQLACVPGVLKQIELYLAAVPHPSSDTVFYIWAGGNDLFNNIQRLTGILSSGKQAITNPQFLTVLKSSLTTGTLPKNSKFPTFSFPLLNLLQAKDRLIAAGANPRNIYFLDTPDMSTLPAGLQASHGNIAIQGVLRSISMLFNFGLTQILVLNPFNKHNLQPWQIIHTSEMLNDIRKNANYYGLHHLSESCVVDGKAPLCEGYMFFNMTHPSATTGKALAQMISNMS